MHRPIGVILLAGGAALAGLYELWRMLVFLGIANFSLVGKTVSYPTAQWGLAIWALILAAIWFWVATGFWNVRAYAWTFGVFISLFTLIWGFMALLFGSSVEQETIPWFLALVILLYLYYPGVKNAFFEHEMSLLTPEQRAAMDNLARANSAAEQAMRAPGMSTPSTTPPPPPATPPATPPAASS